MHLQGSNLYFASNKKFSKPSRTKSDQGGKADGLKDAARSKKDALQASWEKKTEHLTPRQRWGLRSGIILTGLGGALLANHQVVHAIQTVPQIETSRQIKQNAQELHATDALVLQTENDEIRLSQALKDSLTDSGNVLFNEVLAQEGDSPYQATWPKLQEALVTLLSDDGKTDEAQPIVAAYQEYIAATAGGNYEQTNGALQNWVDVTIRTVYGQDADLARQLEYQGIDDGKLSEDALKQLDQNTQELWLRIALSALYGGVSGGLLGFTAFRVMMKE